MSDAPAAAGLDWSAIAALITAGVTALISIYNLLAVLEMRAARRVASEAFLEVLGIGNQLILSIDCEGSTPNLAVEQGSRAVNERPGQALLSLINLSKGPAYDVRVDVTAPLARSSNAKACRRFGKMALAADGPGIVVEGQNGTRTFPILHRMSLRFASIPGDASSTGDFLLSDAVVLAVLAAYMQEEASDRSVGAPTLLIELAIQYRDISRRRILQRKTVVLRYVSAAQSMDSMRWTFEVGDIRDA